MEYSYNKPKVKTFCWYNLRDNKKSESFAEMDEKINAFLDTVNKLIDIKINDVVTIPSNGGNERFNFANQIVRTYTIIYE